MEVGDAARGEASDDFSKRIMVHLHCRRGQGAAGEDVLGKLDPGYVGACPIEPARAAAIGAQRELDMEPAARRDSIDQCVEDDQPAADRNMLQHKVAVHEVEAAVGIGQRVVGRSKGDIGDAGGGGIARRLDKHVRRNIKCNDVGKGGGEWKRQPPDAAAMIECAATREGAEVPLILIDQSADRGLARGEKERSVRVDPAGGKALVGEHAKIRIVATPFPPRLIGTEHGVC